MLVRHDGGLGSLRPERRTACTWGATPILSNAAANLAVPGRFAGCPATTTGAPTTAATAGARSRRATGVKGGLHTDDHAIAFDAACREPRLRRQRRRHLALARQGSLLDIDEHEHGHHPVPGRGHSIPAARRSCSAAPRTTAPTSAIPTLVAPPKPGSTRTSATAASRSSTSSNPERPCYHTYFNACLLVHGPGQEHRTVGQDGPGSWAVRRVATTATAPGYYNGMNPTDPVSFYAPLAQHPAFTPNVVYFGIGQGLPVGRPAAPRAATALPTSSVRRAASLVCTNNDSWVAVSPSLTAFPGFYVSWIGVFPKLIAGKEVLYTGSADGRIAVSERQRGRHGRIAIWNLIDESTPAGPRRWRASRSAAAGSHREHRHMPASRASTTRPPVRLVTSSRPSNGLSPRPLWDGYLGRPPRRALRPRVIVDPSTRPHSLLVGTDIGVFRSREWRASTGSCCPRASLTWRSLALERNREDGPDRGFDPRARHVSARQDPRRLGRRRAGGQGLVRSQAQLRTALRLGTASEPIPTRSGGPPPDPRAPRGPRAAGRPRGRPRAG